MRALAAGCMLAATLVAPLPAQQPAAPATAPASPRASAPFDITGVWVSVVTEDWRWRMLTPAKGDVLGIPVTPQAQKIAESWDYAKDAAAGNECKAFGAGHVLRLPTRLRISWVDDATLKIETDAGQQTKLLHFDASRQPSGPRTLQGHSVAQWIDVFAARGRGEGAGAPPAYGRGTLKVVTTNLREGYLRKNGVPYSQNASVTEYFDLFPVPEAGDWFVVKTVVEDPAYLTGPYVVSSNFMREPDDAKWRPTACEVDPPLVPTKPDVR